MKLTASMRKKVLDDRNVSTDAGGGSPAVSSQAGAREANAPKKRRQSGKEGTLRISSKTPSPTRASKKGRLSSKVEAIATSLGKVTRGKGSVVPTQFVATYNQHTFKDICALGARIEMKVGEAKVKMSWLKTELREKHGLVGAPPRATMQRWCADDVEARGKLGLRGGAPGVPHWRAERDQRGRTELRGAGRPPVMPQPVADMFVYQLAKEAMRAHPYLPDEVDTAIRDTMMGTQVNRNGTMCVSMR